MPNLTAEAAVDRVRALIGDDHNAVSGAVPPEVVLSFLQTEYDTVWARMARAGCVPPAIASILSMEFGDDSAGNYTFFDDEVEDAREALAIIDVFELIDGSYRILLPAQPGSGPTPSETLVVGERATHFTVSGFGEGTQIGLLPAPFATNIDPEGYRVRYIPVAKTLVLEAPEDPDELTAHQTLSIEGLPSCAVDRVCLGAARRCMIRVNSTSPGVERLIKEADEDVQFHVAGRLHGNPPRIRNVDHRLRGWPRRGQDANSHFGDPTRWTWL